jgi:hypothetical protein
MVADTQNIQQVASLPDFDLDQYGRFSKSA